MGELDAILTPFLCSQGGLWLLPYSCFSLSDFWQSSYDDFWQSSYNMPTFKYFDVYPALWSLDPEPSLQQSLSVAKCGFVAFPLYFLSPANLAHLLFHVICFSFSAFLACGAHISGGVSETSLMPQSVWQVGGTFLPIWAPLLPIILGVCPKSPFSLCCSQIDVIYEVVEAKVVACGKKFYAHLSAYEVGCMCVAFMYLDFFPERIFKYGLSYSSFSCTLWLLHRSQVDVGGGEKGMRGRSSLALLKTSLLRIWLGYLFPTSEDERGWSGYFPYGFLRYCKNLDTG